jgi:ADP-heptose:LPS heptosyltransferase
MRYGAIGNTLLAVPLLRALRTAASDCFIGVIASPAGVEALHGCPYIDDLVSYSPHGHDRGLAGYVRMVRHTRAWKCTHALVLRRSARASIIARLSGATTRVGFTGGDMFLTHRVTYVAGRPLADLTLDLVRALGVAPAGTHLEVWPSADDGRAVDAALAQAHIEPGAALLCLHPGGASHRERRWSEERYAEFARLCETHQHLTPVLIGGPGDEDVLARIRDVTGGRYPVITGLRLPAVAELIRRSRAFVGSDSAPSHLAAAVRTPRLVLYGPSPKLPLSMASWGRQGPDDTAYHGVKTGLFCLECVEYPCSRERMRACAATLTAEDLMRELTAVMPPPA